MAVDSKSGSKDTKSIRKNKIESKVYCEQSTGDSSASNKSFVKQSLSKSNHESNVDNDIKKSKLFELCRIVCYLLLTIVLDTDTVALITCRRGTDPKSVCKCPKRPQ